MAVASNATMSNVALTQVESWFAPAGYVPPDAIFALTAQYLRDTFPLKVNLGQGTYRDHDGKPWVLPSVRQAREQLLAQGLDHEYLPILGLPDFRERAAETALGPAIYAERETLAICQSLSGTGALHLVGLLLKTCRRPLPKVYIPEPTWSNHHQVFKSLGFKCESFQYYDYEHKTIDLGSYLSVLNGAEAGSIFIVHACAHNPTGCDPKKAQWHEIGQIMKRRSLFPLFDAAYLGFNSGNLDEDAFAIRHFIDELKLEAAVCVSFAKNMGLYGEGAGRLRDRSAEQPRNSQEYPIHAGDAAKIRVHRIQVSNPPAFGAKIASVVLGSEKQRNAWYKDLKTMSSRIRVMRESLHDALIACEAPGTWHHLKQQTGMFGFLGLTPDVVAKLREQHHIYMASNSRISIAGLTSSNVQYVASCIKECLEEITQ
ncbi:aromatic-amino-acid aminotransferase, partial [Aureobasidium melanogenum]